MLQHQDASDAEARCRNSGIERSSGSGTDVVVDAQDETRAAEIGLKRDVLDEWATRAAVVAAALAPTMAQWY
jgi:hypothetical protein